MGFNMWGANPNVDFQQPGNLLPGAVAVLIKLLVTERVILLSLGTLLLTWGSQRFSLLIRFFCTSCAPHDVLRLK